MKIMVRAAIAALGFASIGPAMAGDGGGPAANTFLTQLPGVIAQAAAPNAPAVATAQNGQPAQVDASRSNHSAWVFPPIGKYLAQ